MKFKRKIQHVLVSFAVLLALWELAVWLGGFSPALLPGPVAVARAWVELCHSGVMFANIAGSIWRFAAGYLLAVTAGAGLGLLLGWYRSAFDYADPVLQLLRPIAPVAWMPFIVLLIGIGDVPAIIIIFLAAFFPVLLTTAAAVRHIDPVYLKVAANYGVGEPAVLYKIVFPAVFPQVANSLHLALGSAWVFLVSGEMIGAQSGLGYMIIDARNNMRTDQLLAAMVAIGVLGFGFDLAIGKFERFILNLWGRDSHVH